MSIHKLAEELDFTFADIGARGGHQGEFEEFKDKIHYIGFEPDALECERLNNTPHQFKSRTLFPHALSDQEAKRSINIYEKQGCNSLLEGDKEIAESFSRGNLFKKVATEEIETITLSSIYNSMDRPIDFLKIDIQGAELSVLRDIKEQLMSDIVGVRVETEFIPLYKEQPLAGSIFSFMSECGFVPLGFAELHCWRRFSKAKGIKLEDSKCPYSKAELAHGDILFVKDFYKKNVDTKILKKIILIAYCYEHFDLAVFLIQKYNISSHCLDSIYKRSKALSKKHLKHEILKVAKSVFTRAKTSKESLGSN